MMISYITEMFSYIDCVCSQMDPLELLRLRWMWKYFHISSKVGLARWDPWIYGNPCRGIKNLAMGEYKSGCSLWWKHKFSRPSFLSVFSSETQSHPQNCSQIQIFFPRETKLAEPDPVWDDRQWLEMPQNFGQLSLLQCLWLPGVRWIILQQFLSISPTQCKVQWIRQ